MSPLRAVVLAAAALVLISSSGIGTASGKKTKSEAVEKKVVCYFPNWLFYSDAPAKFMPENIDASLCTHVVYGFAALDANTLTIKVLDKWADIDNGFYKQVAALKEKGIKPLIAIGGWDESKDDKYSRMVNHPTARRNFVASVVSFCEEHGFVGLDLDWEYPVCWQADCERGPASDKAAFSDLIKELSSALKPRGWLLSAAVSASPIFIERAYDVPTLSTYLDWIGVMAYDYHGEWESKTGHHSPLYRAPGDSTANFNADDSIKEWISRGAAPEKLILGMPFYGRSFTLANRGQHGLDAPTTGKGHAGRYSKEPGLLMFSEICAMVKQGGWTVVRDPEGRIGPYAFKGDQWVGYDDVKDLQRKSRYLKKKRLGGAKVWALGLDDFNNVCGCGKNPLLKTINKELRGKKGPRKNCT